MSQAIRRRCAPSISRPLRLESLEDRRMLSITVTNLNDAGPGSLRAAILEANAAPGPDVIEFGAAAFGTINLTSGELAITDSLTINGPGPDVVTIDANEQSRVFNIDDGSFVSRLDVEIAGVTITGGLTRDGGGIFSRENLTVTNSTISGNTARGSGGGIFALNTHAKYGDLALTVTGSTISGNTAGVGGGIVAHSGDYGAVGVTVTGSTISDNTSDNNGGGIVAHSEDGAVAVTVTGSTISRNTAGDDGGGIGAYSDGDLAVMVTNTTISGNTASSGGGIFAYSPDSEDRVDVAVTVVVTDSTISGNTATSRGGGIHAYFQNEYDDPTVKVTNTTISGNTAGRYGGGIYASSEGEDVAVTVTNSTISGNTAGDGGGGISASDSRNVAVTVTGSILSGNTASGQAPQDVKIFGSFVFDANHSLIGLAASALVTTGSGNISDDNPRLGPLADNGGPTKTHALLHGSPAIDAGDPDFAPPPVFDQRGAPFDRVAGGRIDIGAYERQMLALIVDTVADESDGDYSPGHLSLREAISLAKGSVGPDTITFDTDGVFATPQTITLGLGELAISDALTISGPGAERLTIDANQQSRVFNINDGGRFFIDVEIGGVTITGGRITGRGGGIFSLENLSVTNSTISGNTARRSREYDGGGYGGGILASNDVTVTNSTITGNTTDRDGGGIFARGNATVTNSTITGNAVRGGGGGIFGERDVTIIDSTISGNTANIGGGIYAGDDVAVTNSTISANTAEGAGGGIDAGDHVTVANSIISGNIVVDGVGGETPGDVGGRFSSFDANHSLIGLAASALVTAGSDNISDDNPQLGPLADNGGPTETHALLSGSPAIDAGDPDFAPPPQFDQRGAPFDRVAGGRIDIGAYERQTIADLSLIVDTALDENDGDYSPGDLSLREAIGLANGSVGTDTIGFDTGGLFATPQTITLRLGELAITDLLTINGPGADRLTIDANRQSRVFNIDDGTVSRIDVEIGGLAITGGIARNGGGILSRENLTVTNSTISGNTAGPDGGGIFVGGDVTVTNSTISGNTARRGGGIAANSEDGVAVAVTDSTISGNTASGLGGGISVFSEDGNLAVTVTGSTITGNVAGSRGGGISVSSDGLDLAVTVIDSNVSGNGADYGGGIWAFSGGLSLAVRLTDSTISGNTADEVGGGMYAYSDGGDLAVAVTRSALSDNTAGDKGGGIYARSRFDDLAVTVANSTISGNGAGDGGGGIFAYADEGDLAVTVTNSTISGNTADYGGGIYAYRGDEGDVAVTVSGSILSGNTKNGQVPRDVEIFGPFQFDANHSLLGLAASAGVTAGSNNIVDDNPRLGPLADNGGPTETHALLSGSPAIDAGDPDFAPPPQFDQRGAPFDRVVNGRIDIGAYEFSASILGDLTHDGFVDADDLFVMLANWNTLGGPKLGDLFDDPAKPGINADDLFVLLVAWTGPDPNPLPQAAIRSDGIHSVGRAGDGDPMNRVATSDETMRGDTSSEGRINPATTNGRRIAKRSRTAGRSFRRLQSVAVDRAMAEEETFDRHEHVVARRAGRGRGGRR